MASRKTKKEKTRIERLEEAVLKQAANLDPAQKEFVLAEFETYKWNTARIQELERQLEESMKSECRDLDDEGKLFRQRHQLTAEQSQLFGHMMRWLKDTSVEESEIDEFLSR